jgi:hypothetical protein
VTRGGMLGAEALKPENGLSLAETPYALATRSNMRHAQ